MKNTHLELSLQLAKAYQNACLAEIEALKPGNVHIFADGHDMLVQDFIISAEVSSVVIAQANLSLGERIYRSVEVTWQAVSCNTNLGIILLCAPMIQAALIDAKLSFSQKLIQVLANTTLTDAEWVFKAIRLAKPAGLGSTKLHDVHQPAQCTLLEAMRASSNRDFIGLQYSNSFQHILHEGLPKYQEAMIKWQRPAWAATAVYLYWLAHYPDSHIARKYGLNMAELIQKETLPHYLAFQKQTNPKLYMADLLAFDSALKLRAFNPGSSADLTVATMLIHKLIYLNDNLQS